MKGQAKTTRTNQDKQSLKDIIKEKDYHALSKHLEEGIGDYLQSDTFRRYLDFVSKFHHYSPKNIQLILEQQPKATRVAGFQTWKKMERYVKKGEQALYIYVPSIREEKDKEGKPILDKDGNPKKVVSFLLRPVFDVSQTKGKELPKQLYNIEDDLTDKQLFPKLYQSLVDLSTVPISLESFKGMGSGYYDPTEKKIVIKEGLGQVMTLSTLIHEMTHARLHTDSSARFGDDTYRRQEFEAESIAYVVSSHLGLDTSDYSFGYLASWTEHGHDIELFTDSLKTITEEANRLIQDIDKVMDKVYARELPENKFEERLVEAKKKQADQPRQPRPVNKVSTKEEQQPSTKEKKEATVSTANRFNSGSN